MIVKQRPLIHMTWKNAIPVNQEIAGAQENACVIGSDVKIWQWLRKSLKKRKK